MIFSALSCLHFLFYFFLSFICFAPAQLVFYLASFNAVIAMIFRFRFRSVCLSVDLAGCVATAVGCDRAINFSQFSVLSSLGSLEAKTISFHFHIKDTKRGEQQEFRKEAKKNETIATTNVTEKPQAKAREKPERGRESIGVTGRVREEGRESAANNKGTNKLQQPIGMIINCSVQFASVCDFDFVRYK